MLEVLQERLVHDVMDRPGSSSKLDEISARIAAKETDVYSAIDELIGEPAGASERTGGPRLINHLGIATKGLDAATEFWVDALGLENVHTETVEDQKVRVAMLPLGESRIELLEPTSDDSPISKFLAKRGGGIHHIAVEVRDIHATVEKLKAKGVRMIDEAPRTGAENCLIAFVHPASTGGVLLELVQTER